MHIGIVLQDEKVKFFCKSKSAATLVYQAFLLFPFRDESLAYTSFFLYSGIEYPVGLLPIGIVYRIFGRRFPGWFVPHLDNTCLRYWGERPS